jgi:CheY-like chemotaxis protein
MVEIVGMYLSLVGALVAAVPWIMIASVPFFMVGMVLLIPLIYIFQGPLSRLGARRIKRVLIADDDPISVLPLLGALYAEADVELCFVESGAEAVEQLQKNSYDLAILDLSMPDMTGVDVLFKTDAQGPHWNRSMPVVFYTSNKQLADNVYKIDFGKFSVRDVWDKDTPVRDVDRMVKRQLAAI